MRPNLFASVVLGSLVLGCTPPAPLPPPPPIPELMPVPKPAPVVEVPKIPFTEKDVSVVIAKQASNETGALGISDTQLFDGKIAMYATLLWNEPLRPGILHEVELCWFSGDRKVGSNKKKYLFSVPPHHIWWSTSVTDIGLGKGRAEVWVEGRRLASREFNLVERKASEGK